MHTQLPQFCGEFDALLRPFLAPVERVLAALEQSGPDRPERELRPPLLELRHHLGVLADKVASQQAYVLIFGPLKSGKSTLMNAVAAAYVSEVSSLPAYPCLVFVAGGPRREYVVTRYDGSRVTFTAARPLQDHIDAAHAELADAIRAAEGRGEVFDPPEHFPQAVRRVDVTVPGGELQRSGAVLVDTPGLYTRMRFGYDRMTRDFRDAAACAVFVVKSDTLFLEQVFHEFQQLLDLFSRIFLVVNVDAGKRDLGPDGALVPSLEQSQPDRILAAFTDLAMTAPLQRAHQEGRVRICAVDLLAAASAVLRQDVSGGLPADFAAFRDELNSYLAGSDYLQAFLRDSLQRARGLLKEARTLADDPVADALRAELAARQRELAAVQALQSRLRTVLRLDLRATGHRFGGQLAQEVERSARDEGQKLVRTLGASIDTWFLSSHSLDWLLNSHWTPLVQDYRADVQDAARRCFDQFQAQPGAGLDLPEALDDLIDAFGIDLVALRQRLLQDLGAVTWQGPATVPVDPGQLPVRKGVLDLVAFRSVERVRERMLGSVARPERKLSAKEKAGRLGEPGRLFLHQRVGEFRAALAPATAASLVQHFTVELRDRTAARLVELLREQEPRLLAEAERLQREQARLQAVLAPLDALATAAAELETQLRQLGGRYGAPLPEAVPRPVLTPVARSPRPARSETRPSRGATAR